MIIKQNKAVKYRAYPTQTQANLIDRTIGCARKIYNLMLEDKEKHYKETGEHLSVTPAAYKKDYPYLKEVDSTALSNAWKNLTQAYKNHFKNPGKFGLPQFKAKHHSKASYTSNYVNNNIRYEEDGKYIRLPKVGLLRIRQHIEVPSDWKLKSVTVEHTPAGRYEVTVLFEYDTQVPDHPRVPETYLGLDYSSSALYVDSNGEVADYPRFYRELEHKLVREQRKLSRMVPGSNNWVKQARRVARVHEKIRNSRRDYQCKKVLELARAYDCVVVEDLDMRAMSQSLKLGKSTMDNAFGMFRNQLARKLEESGGRLVRVGKFYPSSQLCHDCGYQNKAVKDLSVREWVCPACGAHHDRDVNAALNLRDEGRRLVLEELGDSD